MKRETIRKRYIEEVRKRNFQNSRVMKKNFDCLIQVPITQHEGEFIMLLYVVAPCSFFT